MTVAWIMSCMCHLVIPLLSPKEVKMQSCSFAMCMGLCKVINSRVDEPPASAFHSLFNQ
ncbi:hypothetical protein BDR03DRAFT_955775 [Suillus americanus]|nr:hypothetical protein BDR03DRAFT_955775 [Suillus americanus]